MTKSSNCLIIDLRLEFVLIIKLFFLYFFIFKYMISCTFFILKLYDVYVEIAEIKKKIANKPLAKFDRIFELLSF